MLGKDYFPSELVFPLHFLVNTLEKHSSYLQNVASDATPDWVAKVMLGIGVTYSELWSIYDRLFSSQDDFWAQQNNCLHLLEVICSLLEQWLEFLESPRANSYDRRQFTSKGVHNSLDNFLTALYAIPKNLSDPLVGHIKDLAKRVK